MKQQIDKIRKINIVIIFINIVKKEDILKCVKSRIKVN